jgi:2-dehydro-3-deoxyphosphogluconate aldolase/(4S)-4-hydroxy-2-oxoglutarate aldolase
LAKHAVVPCASLADKRDAVPLAAALQKAGLPLLQISLSTAAGLPAIESIRSVLPQFSVGAGAILSPGQVRDAMAAGALFGAGPAMSPGLLAAASSAEFPFLPGAITPTEVACGIQWGFLLQCFWPASAAGGPLMVQALTETYRHTGLLLVPAGGLSVASFPEYLSLPGVCAVAGDFPCEHALIQAGMWEDIAARAVLTRSKAESTLRMRAAQTRPKSLKPEKIFRFNTPVRAAVRNKVTRPTGQTKRSEERNGIQPSSSF